MSSRYPSDLTDAEWKRIEPIFDRFRFDEHNPRELHGCRVLSGEKRMPVANAP